MKTARRRSSSQTERRCTSFETPSAPRLRASRNYFALPPTAREATFSDREHRRPGRMKLDSNWAYFRSFGGVYRVLRTGENSEPQLLWQAPNGGDIDANASVVYWNQSATNEFQGCLGRANSDGTDGRCLDQGPGD